MPSQKGMLPPIKWVGGKIQLLQELIKRMPKEFNKNVNGFYEPFLGGGALYLNIQPVHGNVGDINKSLINVYDSIIKSNEILIDYLDEYTNLHNTYGSLEQKKEFFYARREQYNKKVKIDEVGKRLVKIDKFFASSHIA